MWAPGRAAVLNQYYSEWLRETGYDWLDLFPQFFIFHHQIFCSGVGQYVSNFFRRKAYKYGHGYAPDGHDRQINQEPFWPVPAKDADAVAFFHAQGGKCQGKKLKLVSGLPPGHTGISAAKSAAKGSPGAPLLRPIIEYLGKALLFHSDSV